MEENKKTKKGLPLWLKVLLIILVIFILLIVGVVSVGWWFVNSKLDSMDYVDLSANEIEVNSEVTENTNANINEYRNIALFGIDARSDTFSGSRSDCIIIVSINNTTKDVKLLSVYRDTYLNIDGHGLDKVTHAYAYGGPRLSLSTLNKNLDLNITEFVTVNFETVKTVVESIGGVNITVTDEEASKIPAISSAGTYNLNGNQALTYSRIRKIDTDYKRTERMRTVLNAIFTKVKSLNLAELNNLVDVVLPHVSTNISKNEIINLLPSVISYNITDSEGWPYNVKGITLSAWYGVPVTLEENVKKLHGELFGETDYQPSSTVKEISNSIIQKTGYR